MATRIARVMAPATAWGLMGKAAMPIHTASVSLSRRGDACGQNPRGDGRPLDHAALDEMGLGYGMRVVKVQPGSAAEAAGIQAEDIILEFDGKPVYSGERLRWLVRKGDEDRTVGIKLQRDKEAITLSATPQTPEPKPKCEKRPVRGSST
jgi:S1-C subfamily serine protease